MKILHVLTSPRAEGTPKLVLDWLKTSNVDVEHVVCFLTNNPSNLLQEYRRYTSNILLPDLYKGGFTKKVKLIINYFKSVMSNIAPDICIIWVTGMSPWISIGIRISKMKNTKILIHSGNPPYGDYFQRKLLTYVYFWILNILKAQTIVPSDYILNQYKSYSLLNTSSFHRVYNCINIRKFKDAKFIPQLKLSANDAIMVATLENHKDHATLFKAWKIVEEALDDCHLKIVGAGKNQKKLLELCNHLKLKSISFLGSREDVDLLLKSSDLFVFSTTKGEGFGTVLLEAMASGLPVIATNVPACNETLLGGKFGKLVPANDPKKMAESILGAIKRPIDEDEILAQIEYVNRFTPEDMMTQYLKIAGLLH